MDTKDSRDSTPIPPARDSKRARVSSEELSPDSDALRAVRFDIRELTDAIRSLAVDLKRVGKTVEEVRSEVRDQTARMDAMERKMDVQNGKLIQTVERLKGMEREMKDRQKAVEKKMREIEKRVVDQEARSRRNNLLFFGVEESEKENCEELVRTFCRGKLNMEKSETKNLVIQRAHRLGQRKGEKTRPIIVAFRDFQAKEAVLARKRNLIKPFGVAEDFPKEIRDARRTLIEDLVAHKKAGRRATIVYPAKLLVDGQVAREVHILE